MGRGIGSALMSVGEDVAQYSNAEANRRQQAEIARLQDERVRQLSDDKLAIHMLLAEARGQGSRRGGLMANAMSDELMAASAGLNVPEFQEARKFAQTGEAPTTREPNMTVDQVTGKPTVDLGDSSREAVDIPNRERIRANVARMRTGLLAGNVDPKDFDQLQKGLTEATTRGAAFAKDADTQDTGRRVAAMKGEGEFTVQGNMKLNKFTGDAETTEVGESVITKNELTGEAAKVRAAIQRARSAGGGADTVQRTIETGDGRVMIIYRSGRKEVLTDESGRPIPSGSYAKEIGRVVKNVESSPWYFGRGKEDAKGAEVDRRISRQFGDDPRQPPRANSAVGRPALDSFFK